MAESRQLNPREKARLEEQKKNRKTRNRYILIGVIVVLVIALVAFVNSRAFVDGLPALKVGDDKYTVADVNYEYQANYMQFTNTYGDYLSYFLDTSVPLDQQPCTMDTNAETWHDYFLNMAETSLTQRSAFLQAARNAGYTLTEEERAQIDNAISNYGMYADLYGYSLDGYLAANFGAGNNEKNVRRNMEGELLVNDYLNGLYEGFTFTDQEKDDYYDEHAETLDKVNILYRYTSDSSDENAAAKHEELLTAAQSGDAESFRKAVKDLTDSEATETSYSVSSFLSMFAGSVSEEEIVSGHAFNHHAESGWYTVYVKDLDDNRYNTVSVRHILIKVVDTDGNGEYSDEEKQAALDELQDIRDEWLEKGGTEEAFIELAATYSEDAGSSSDGGLYRDIYKGQMVPEFNAFCFAGHESGDTDIVYGETSQYAGYHLIYFVNADGDLYSRTLADNELRSQAYNDAVAMMTDGLEPQRTFMWRYVMSD